ncbi:hypothetical protein GS501_05030 [Saccharibacter sp. 17.LH.SD]|uniref:IucA/IucC family protein n=1 Tax=Saccharibacter sp. 17.LH.SD TaxID=2689393 RepID=UPI00136B7518|nr:IucA/IucC family protein [Saccharibacter sp. 17.LH.SD]MXV44411.1 hypothetical protein [Saccharibacter sp. 17.LH.SD]
MSSSHEILTILAHVMHPVVTQGLVPVCRKFGLHPVILTDHPAAYQRSLSPKDATVIGCDVFNPLAVIRTLSDQHIQPRGVLSNSDHLQTSTALVAARFGLPGKDWRLCLIAKHKGETRKYLRKMGLPTPWFYTLATHDPLPENIPFPIVAKPVEGVASLDVRFCETVDELIAFRDDMIQRRPQTLQLEAYLQGPLFTIETWGDGQDLHAIGGFDVTLSPPPYFIERSALWNGPVSRHHRHKALEQLRKIGIGLGVCHSEFIATLSGPVLVEINYRSVGDGREFCLDRLCDGAWFEGLIALHLGQPVGPLLPRHLQDRHCAIYYHLAEQSGRLMVLPDEFVEKIPGGEARYHSLKTTGEMIKLSHSNKDTLGILTLTAATSEALASLRRRFLPRLTSFQAFEGPSSTILRRVLDAALREDCCQIVSKGDISPSPRDGVWRLCVQHLSGGTLWLDVVPEHFMQTWRMYEPYWWWQDRHGKLCVEQEADSFLSHLSEGLSPFVQENFALYGHEIRCAINHTQHCYEAAQKHLPSLSHALTHSDWRQRLLGIDRIASYTDHPLYPTARAKNGFTSEDLTRYAPEFCPQFYLRWVAFPRSNSHEEGGVPPFWPRMRDVGLPESLEATHFLFPVHPLTWATYEESEVLPATAHPAPCPFLEVTPTLSVRTVALCADPAWHIKVPLQIATLGARNIRFIKPTTLHDGYTVSQILARLQDQNPELRQNIVLVDESRYGFAHNMPSLAFLVRHYPLQLSHTTPVPVAALTSPLADGRLLVAWVVEQFHGGDWLEWARQYTQLFLTVHLRLWLHYGIALESNQQNAVLLYSALEAPRLLMKDNDAARLWSDQLLKACPEVEPLIDTLRDQRLLAENDSALGEMFCTITLQLCLAVPFEMIARAGYVSRHELFRILRDEIHITLSQLEREGWPTAHARALLLEADYLPAKYLMSAGSLFPKELLGVSDINKFYGYSAPNFLKESQS